MNCGDGIVQGVLSPLAQKLDAFMSRKWDLVAQLDVKIQSLQTDLVLLQAFLKDMNVSERDNERAKVWLSQAKDIACRAEDAIDKHRFMVWFQSKHGFMGSLKNFGNRASRLKTSYDLAVEVEGIINRLQTIKASKSVWNIVVNQSKGNHHVSSDGNHAQSHHENLQNLFDNIEMFAFVRDVKMLSEKLLTKNTRRIAICIVGMSKKTTLARKVYDSDNIKSHFQFRSWVSGSHISDYKDLLQIILNQLTEDPIKDRRPYKMVEKNLKDKRYLLVIDDLSDKAVWDKICEDLPEGVDGSRIIITTRVEEVARRIDLHEGFIYKSQYLTAEESWELFCLKVFGRREGCPDHLKDMRERIVSKCPRSSLAIGVIGGLLSREPNTEDGWTKVLDRIPYELNEGEHGQALNRILMLSFEALPHYLRPCFLYFGLFPKTSEIDAELLVQMWVAEGFVENRGQQTMEEVGEDYLKELANRSMIQVVQRDMIGKISKCRIYAGLHSVPISRGKEEKFSCVLNVEGQLQNDKSSIALPRCLAVHRSLNEDIVPLAYSSSFGSVRSVLGFGLSRRRDLKNIIGSLRLLRVLNLEGLKVVRLPKEIGQLMYLKFLGLGDAYVETLPSSLGMLFNLQTLRIGSCEFLPETLWKIETLRHIIIINDNYGMREVKCATSCKANLQTLRGIRAGVWIEKFLQKFTRLRVLSITEIRENHVAILICCIKTILLLKSLELSFLWEEGSIEKVKPLLAKLKNFPSLHHLRIDVDFIPGEEEDSSWMCGLVGGMKKRNLPQLQNEGKGPTPSPLGFRFPKSLVRLKLCFPPDLFSKEDELLEPLSYLLHLKMLELGYNVYSGKELTFSHNYKFEKLEEFELSEMSELEQCSIRGKGTFPCLKRLGIYDCGKLKAVPEGLLAITTLQELGIYGSLSDELRGRLEQGGGEDWDKIKRIPSVFINDVRVQVEQQQQMSSPDEDDAAEKEPAHGPMDDSS